MKLKAFRVENYRSIIDTGWCKLSNDNITVLIGQNESGKTSVLEGLQSFFTGSISDDILRSDLSTPKVTCSLRLDNQKIEDIIDFSKVPEEAAGLLKELKSISISREWDELFDSFVSVEEESIKKFFSKKEEKKEESLNKTYSQLDEIARNCQEKEKEYNQLKKQYAELRSKTEEIKSELKSQNKTAQRSRKEKKRLEAEEKAKELEGALNEKEKALKDTAEKVQHISEQLQQKEQEKKIADYAESAKRESLQLESEVEETYEKVKEMEATYHLINSPKEQKANGFRLDEIKNNYLSTTKKLNEKKKQYQYWVQVAEKILNGMAQDKAEEEVKAEIEEEEKYYTLESLGNIIFNKAPVFEFFHDFSSLLPDTIDLEDMIYGKENVKGYKAVRNYLEIANLKPEFFDQKSSRILKQKIEKLNKEITVDFHEYWRQTIGDQNKIQISFELEHYDHNTPEKLGKPYIEFWIKDKDERLYPKQRSRGVRWFLSFYLELKAFAKYKNRNRVLLIDEPAMSLHARAQEDVLKVFEDIKTELQVIYTTHSPHLVDVNKLYRILALQRTEQNGYSETRVYDTNSFKQASSDTLSPIYSLMGARLNEQKFIQKENNIIVEDIATYYYLSALAKITGLTKNLYFIPASDTSQVITLANLLLGWKLGFVIILGNNAKGTEVYEYFKNHLFRGSDEKTKQKIIRLEKNQKHIEDLFSTIDFKKYILNKRVGITESNSDYIKNNNLSRSFLASDFLSLVDSKKLKIEDFDEQTQENINDLIDKLQKNLGKKIS